MANKLHHIGFLAGQESFFSAFVDTYIRNKFSEDRLKPIIEDDIKELEDIFNCSINNFDVVKLWDTISKRNFCKDTVVIFEGILKRLNVDDFRSVIDKFDNYKLVYNYYMLYARIHDNYSQMIDMYIEYLENLLKRVDENLESIFEYYFQCLFGYYGIVANKSGEREYNGFLDEYVLNSVEVGYIIDKKYIESYQGIQILCDYPCPMLELVRRLMSRINLNHLIIYKKEVLSLRNFIPAILVGGNTYPNYSASLGKMELIKEFVELNPGEVFKLDQRNVRINIIQLCAIVGNVQKIREILDIPQFEVCSNVQYEELKETGHCHVDQINGADDLLGYGIPNRNFSHKELLEILMHDKVRMLSIDTIRNIKDNEYLSEEEFKQLLDHIKEKGIIVYFCEGDEAFVISNIERALAKTSNTKVVRLWYI